ncbi:MAG: peptidase S8 and S53 subtilisin kexin sedolisin [Acidimicrobiia bacterium]|nr:peptidase S8 and S53 subtilisin kexin sedolisin [Acidimicrobiia bacterium]
MPAEKLVGKQQRKLHPKLRVIANGSTQVNTLRSEHCSSIAVDDEQTLKSIAPARGAGIAAAALEVAPPKIETQKKLATGVKANVFIRTAAALENGDRFPGEQSRRRNLAVASVTMDQLKEITDNPNVTHVELGEPLRQPEPLVTATGIAAPAVSLRKFGDSTRHKDGEGVLVGIIDVQGFDFSHPDFLSADKKTTRFVRIWDQGGTTRPAPAGAAFHFGSEIRQEHMNAALQASSSLPAWELEPQSQMDPGSHGTHVASTAAGNAGVCRRSPIAAVLISLTEDDFDRRKSFFDSTRLALAVDYLVQLATEMKLRLSVNISLGTNGHAHDGSNAISRWIDSALAIPGRAVCAAAGNAGQEKGETPDDFGWIMGRIHTSGRVPSAGLTRDIEVVVVGNGIMDISENELEIWYSAQDRFSVSVRPPGGNFIGPIHPREFIENRELSDGSFLSVYNELYHPANGANYISVYLSPRLDPSAIVGVRAGTWTIRLHGDEVRDGRYHGWIERDDPRRRGRVGPREAWNFPSFFTEASNVDDSSVSSLACTHRVISVANLDSVKEKINITSSQGPTRDGRTKPDVAAPGTDIVAANGFAGPDDLWVGMTGTSMASPLVCGVVGLMLAVEPGLTAAQMEGILHRTAIPLPGANFEWRNDAGFGVINPEACLEEARRASERTDRT